MKNQSPDIDSQQSLRAVLSSYVSGFILSVLLTIVAYGVVVQHALSRTTTIVLLACLAVTQCLVQLVFFLHLGSELKPRWRLLVFGFAVGVVLIIVFGSVWIMDNLNYNMMTPSNLLHYMRTEEGI